MISAALSTLRLATADLHVQLEDELVIAHPGANKEDFLHYLEDMWGWLKPIEEPLWSRHWPADVNAVSRSNKLAWIESDLRSGNNAATASLPVAPVTLDMSSLPARFGIAYVIEGAQLGTKVLRKRLEPALGSWSSRWLDGYGEHNGSQWRAFLESMESSLQTDTQREHAAKSAVQAFSSLAHWFALCRETRMHNARVPSC